MNEEQAARLVNTIELAHVSFNRISHLTTPDQVERLVKAIEKIAEALSNQAAFQGREWLENGP